jgi:hypothetical protein
VQCDSHSERGSAQNRKAGKAPVALTSVETLISRRRSASAANVCVFSFSSRDTSAQSHESVKSRSRKCGVAESLSRSDLLEPRFWDTRQFTKGRTEFSVCTAAENKCLYLRLTVQNCSVRLPTAKVGLARASESNQGRNPRPLAVIAVAARTELLGGLSVWQVWSERP